MERPRTVPIELVRAAAAFSSRRGWDVGALLQEAGVASTLLSDPRSRVTEDQVVDLVQHMWRVTDDEMFGLGSHPLPRGSFRLLCYGLLGSDDLGDALSRLRGFLRAVPALPVAIGSDGTTTTLSLTTPADPEEEPLVLATALAGVHRLLSWLVRRELPLTDVLLPFGRPDDLELLRIAFTGPLTFGAESASLRFDNQWLATPINRSESDVEALVADSPRGLLTRPSYATTFEEQVRRLVERDLRRGEASSAASVAGRLAVSPQTLRRRLAETDTSLRQITEQVRRDEAVLSLVAGTESVAALAARLGFSEPSAFSRAFRRWTGSSPGAYRAAEESAPERESDQA